MGKIKFRRPLEQAFPTLDEGEPGFTRDTERFFIGSSQGNLEFQKKMEIGSLNDLQTTEKSNLVGSINEIVKRLKFVTYEMFGAPLNGIDDDTLPINACHNFANANNLKVIQNSGTIYLKSTNINGSPIIKTDTDLTGSSILIDQTMGNNVLYVVDGDSPQQTVTVTPTMQSQMVEDAVAIPALASYEYCIFNVVSDQLLGKRSDANLTPFNMQEPFTVGTNGALIDGPLLLGYTTGNLTLTYRSILDKAITIRGAKLLINTTDKDHLAQAFSITRSNVTLTNLQILVQGMPYNNTSVYNFKNALVATVQAYNVNYDNFTGENASALLASSTDTTQGQYVFTYTMSSKCKISNCNLQKGWVVLNTQFIKTMVVRDSIMNNYDNHWGMSDLLIENLRIVGNNAGIKLGWGKGTTIIRDYELDFTNANSSITGENFAVAIKPDLGLVYEGKIIVENATVNIFEDLPSFNFFQCNLNESFAHNTTRQVKLPDIDMRKVRVDAKKVSSSITVYGAYFDIGGTSFVGKNITRGKTIIKDLTLVNETKNVRKLAAYRYVNAVPDAINPSIPQIIDMENVGQLDKTTYNTNVPIVQIQEANTATNTKSKVRLKNCVGKIQVGDHAVVDIDAFKLIGEMSRNSDPTTAQMNNVTLDNCDLVTILGVVNLTGYNRTNIDTLNVDVLQTVNMNNCTVGGTLSSTGTTSAIYVMCVLKPGNNGTYTYVQLQNTVMKFCEIIINGSYPIALDPVTNAPFYLQGNILNGTAKDQGTTDFMYKYIKTSYAQPTVAV